MGAPQTLGSPLSDAARANATLPTHDAMGADADAGLLVPGRNCWRVERADAFGICIDAEEYFSAARQAMAQARHRIRLLAWDIDSRIDLTPQGCDDDLPARLGPFLAELVRRCPTLHIDVLCWDYAMLYWMEREWMPRLRFSLASGGQAASRLRFRTDNLHPTGASHHQKVLVVDDHLAFVGGLDFTKSRWDRRAHAPDDKLRINPDGDPFGPFHDVQAVVSGPCARALAELCIDRWTLIGEKPTPLCDHAEELDCAMPWPRDVPQLLRDVDVGISRTHSAVASRKPVQEIRQLHLDAIAAARRLLFFENQYFTSTDVAQALAARLAEKDGPDVAIVTRHLESGWLEQASMGVLRCRVHQRMVEADVHKRYRLVAPCLPGLKEGCLNVHSKVFTVDDSMLQIGSANLSNRSMTLDTEVALVVEARGNAEIARGIAWFRHRLLSEHLDVPIEQVRDAESTADHQDLIGAIRTLTRPGGRTLAKVDASIDPALDAIVPVSTIVDPGEGLAAESIARSLLPPGSRRAFLRRHWSMLATLVFFIGLALAWQFTPLRHWASVQELSGLMERIAAEPLAPLLVVAVFVVAGLVAFPITVMIVVTGIVYGIWWGSLYALIGIAASATLGYLIGNRLGYDSLHALAGKRLQALTRAVRQRGILGVALIRWVPLAPFAIVNAFAGATGLPLRTFLLGTMLGMTPGVAMMNWLAHGLIEAVRHPGPLTLSVVLATLLLLAGFGLLLRRWLRVRSTEGAG